MVEEGAYRRLLDAYYGRESPLPLDISQCKKLARVTRAPAEHRAVEYVLSQFFDKEPDGYHQKRCDEEIQRFRSKSDAGRANANARWNHATASNPHMPNGSERNGASDATALNSHRVGNALQSPVSSNHTPDTTHSDLRAPAGARVGGTFKKAGSGWRPPKSAEEYEREAAERAEAAAGESAQKHPVNQSPGGRHANR